MKEEAQGFPTACGSIGFCLHPKALGFSEKVTFLGKSNFTMGSSFAKCVSVEGALMSNTLFIVRSDQLCMNMRM